MWAELRVMTQDVMAKFMAKLIFVRHERDI